MKWLRSPGVVWGLNVAWALMVAAMALLKIGENALMAQTFKGYGLRPWMTTIGFVELAALLLYLFPPTLRPGFFLLNAFFGGAVATALQHGDRPWPPLAMYFALWFLAWLRGPHLFRNDEVRTSEWDYLKQPNVRGR